jgi:hypothetical protein
MMSTIALQRLHQQRIAQHHLKTPVEIVAWLGAVQSQDYGMAKWAVGQRLQAVNEAALEQAFTDGAILRTHVLRPTWHFVTPADIRWMLQLTAPRVHQLNGYWYRKLEIDAAVASQTITAIIRALQGGKHMTSAELATVLQQAGIAGIEERLLYLILYAELEGIICSGARQGKQFTYALLDEHAPAAKLLQRDEALAELARRYFTSHGPATLQDYGWWSGLTVADVKASLALIQSELHQEVIDGQTYWMGEALPVTKSASPTVYLLPNYDEYLVGYTDRSAIFDAQHTEKLDSRGNVLFNHTIVVDGLIAGTWKRTLKKQTVVIETTLFRPLTAAEQDAFAAAAKRYGEFLGLSAVLA